MLVDDVLPLTSSLLSLRFDSRGVRDVRSSYEERDRRVDVGRGVRDSWKDGLPQSPPIQPIEAVLGPDTPKLRLGADAGFKDGPTSPVRNPPGLHHGCLPGGVLPDTAVVLASCTVCVMHLHSRSWGWCLGYFSRLQGSC
jgi:hypothetical protein